MNALLSTNLWPRLRELSDESARKRAAIAYVSSEQHVQFSVGDTLIVDASDSTIASGGTSAEVLANAFARGAEIYSLQYLHAKILVFDTVASVGSANASTYSAQTLVEANWISDQNEFHASANEFIDGLIGQAIRIDQEFLDRISDIEVKNKGSNRYRRQRSHPILLYFQEVLPGDIDKYRTTSAHADTGGGARDLRISPVTVYEPILRRMFPIPAANGATSGTIAWDSNGIDQHAVANLQPPTNARPNEIRIGRFYDIGGWNIDPDQYEAERDQGLLWFYVLEMGRDGVVYARLLQRQHLELEDPLVAEHLERQREGTRTDHATRGAVDLQNRTCIPERE